MIKGVISMTEKEIQPIPETREQYKENKVNVEKKLSHSRKIKIRLLPIWVKILLVVILMVISIVSGVIVGYGVIGDGSPKDALKESTWTHIIDIVNKK